MRLRETINAATDLIGSFFDELDESWRGEEVAVPELESVRAERLTLSQQ